ncbi:hypothetical protein [Micromonospora sp. WMMD737]|uniref:hypothetical protein n=1 Tax=Micromonospora sp. WMMD737 TaxID=3404113 RepID=UPI003B952147
MTLPGLPGVLAVPRRCRGCRQPVPTGRTWDGYGEKCAEKRGLIPRKVRVRRRKTTPDVGPGLLGFLNAASPLTEGDDVDAEDVNAEVTGELETDDPPG